MNRKTSIFAVTIAAMALTGFAVAQTTETSGDALAPWTATSASTRLGIVPRKTDAGMIRVSDDDYRGGGEYGHHGRYREGHDDDHDGFRLFGRNWHWDWDDDDDDDDDDHGRHRGSVQNPVPSGSAAPPANGLFNNGAAPRAQVQ